MLKIRTFQATQKLKIFTRSSWSLELSMPNGSEDLIHSYPLLILTFVGLARILFYSQRPTTPTTPRAPCRRVTIPRGMVASTTRTCMYIYQAKWWLSQLIQFRYHEDGVLKGHLDKPWGIDQLNASDYNISGSVSELIRNQLEPSNTA
jgi:hypothetical protein